jgi:hypothetical protein
MAILGRGRAPVSAEAYVCSMTWHPDDVTPAEGALRRPVTSRETVVVRPRADTAQVSALQLLPLLPIVITLVGTLPGGWNTTTLASAVAVTAVIQYFVARADVVALGRRGFVEQAPAVLALVSPIWYLTVRGRRCDGHDPSAAGAVTWAIIATVTAVIIGTAGTVFAWAIAGVFEAVNGGG